MENHKAFFILNRSKNVIVKKWKPLIVVILFSLLLAAPLLKMDWIGGSVSSMENRVLAKFPISINQETRTISVGRGQIETWINDNIGFRDIFMKIYANLKFKILGIVTSDKVQKGRDEWYFYTLDHNIEIASGAYPNFDEKMLSAICEQQLRIQKKLREQGIEYVLILPPSKVSVYPEKLLSGDYGLCKTPVDILADYLEEHSDLKVVRVKDALLDAKQKGTEQLFFKTDTHWTEYGAYVGYRAVINSLNQWNLIESDPADVSFLEGAYPGEFSAMLGDSSLLPAEKVLKSKIIDPKAVPVTEGELFLSFRNVLMRENIQDLCYFYQNKTSSGPGMLMYGDSMFGHWNLPALLAENSSTFAFVRDGDIEQEMIDTVKPEIVLYEITERFLNNLYTRSCTFIQKDIINPEAQITFQDIPPRLMAGQASSFSVTVKNTGGQAWNELDQVRLGIFQNGVDCGYGGRAYLPAGVSVAPGETYTFTFQDFVPSIPGAKLEFTMLQEGITYFGERREADTEIISK